MTTAITYPQHSKPAHVLIVLGRALYAVADDIRRQPVIEKEQWVYLLAVVITVPATVNLFDGNLSAQLLCGIVNVSIIEYIHSLIKSRIIRQHLNDLANSRREPPYLTDTQIIRSINAHRLHSHTDSIGLGLLIVLTALVITAKYHHLDTITITPPTLPTWPTLPEIDLTPAKPKPIAIPPVLKPIALAPVPTIQIMNRSLIANHRVNKPAIKRALEYAFRDLGVKKGAVNMYLVDGKKLRKGNKVTFGYYNPPELFTRAAIGINADYLSASYRLNLIDTLCHEAHHHWWYLTKRRFNYKKAYKHRAHEVEARRYAKRCTVGALAAYNNKAKIKTYKKISWLSETEESSGRGVNTISTGIGDAGGVSYGRFQLASAVGTMSKFLNSKEGRPFKSHFAGYKPGSAKFNRRYRTLATGSHHRDFDQAQIKFIQRTHAMPVIRYAKKVGINTHSFAVQSALFSAGVQHSFRGNKLIINRAIKRLGQGASLRKTLTVLYDERNRFASKRASKKATTLRYKRELKAALKLLNTIG